MSRRIPGREPILSGSVQLRAWRGPVVSAPVPTPNPPFLASGEAQEPVAALDEQWTEYLAAPNRHARDRLVIRYTPLVRVIAHRVLVGMPTHVDHSDLAQSGMFGLIDAIERFDPSRCPRFESFAAQRIRGAILDELRAQDWVPRTVRGRVKELERAQERLERQLQRAPTDREVAHEMGLPVRDVQGLIRQVHVVSVEALDETGGGVSELFADAAPDPMAVVQARETMRQLNAAVAGLGERDRMVIQLYYLENRTLAEIGRMLGVTESRVCQLHARLVGRLRGRLDGLVRT
jgi:RNA polymerase sigma factor for flagellar operon FliA